MQRNGALQARNTLGVHAALVEAKNSAAEGFYRKYSFRLCDSIASYIRRFEGESRTIKKARSGMAIA